MPPIRQVRTTTATTATTTTTAASSSSTNIKPGPTYKYIGKTKPTQRFPCDLCDKTFTRNTDVGRHINAIHRGSSRYKCSYPGCFYTSDQKSNVESHEPTHCPVGLRKEIKCPFFGLDGCTFKTSAVQTSVPMNRHYLKVHKGKGREREYERYKRKISGRSEFDLDLEEEAERAWLQCYRVPLGPKRENDPPSLLPTFDLVSQFGLDGQPLTYAAQHAMFEDREVRAQRVLDRRPRRENRVRFEK